MEDINYLKQQIEIWKAKAEEARNDFDEFQQQSAEYENEMEAEIGELKRANANYLEELGELKQKYRELLRQNNEAYSSYQSEREKMKKNNEIKQAKERELEIVNDDLERKLRIASSSYQDLQVKYNQLLEKNVYLQQEIESKMGLVVTVQRLKDELKDANIELAVLRSKLKDNMNINHKKKINNSAIYNKSTQLTLLSNNDADDDNESMDDNSYSSNSITNINDSNTRNRNNDSIDINMGGIEDDYPSLLSPLKSQSGFSVATNNTANTIYGNGNENGNNNSGSNSIPIKSNGVNRHHHHHNKGYISPKSDNDNDHTMMMDINSDTSNHNFFNYSRSHHHSSNKLHSRQISSSVSSSSSTSSSPSLIQSPLKSQSQIQTQSPSQLPPPSSRKLYSTNDLYNLYDDTDENQYNNKDKKLPQLSEPSILLSHHNSSSTHVDASTTNSPSKYFQPSYMIQEFLERAKNLEMKIVQARHTIAAARSTSMIVSTPRTPTTATSIATSQQ